MTRRVNVTAMARRVAGAALQPLPVMFLNELEFIHGRVFANVWSGAATHERTVHGILRHDTRIAVIDPVSGGPCCRTDGAH